MFATLVDEDLVVSLASYCATSMSKNLLMSMLSKTPLDASCCSTEPLTCEQEVVGVRYVTLKSLLFFKGFDDTSLINTTLDDVVAGVSFFGGVFDV